MREKISYNMVVQRLNVGPSAIIGITAVPGQLSLGIQYLSGGTLEIMSPSYGFTGTPVSGQGYPIQAGLQYNFDCAGTIYLASVSATSVVSVVRGLAKGFEGASLGFKG